MDSEYKLRYFEYQLGEEARMEGGPMDESTKKEVVGYINNKVVVGCVGWIQLFFSIFHGRYDGVLSAFQ